MTKRFAKPYSHPRWWEGNYIPGCFECMYFEGMIEGQLRCKAFPEGIPHNFMKKDAEHNEPYPGDHGIQFKQYVREK